MDFLKFVLGNTHVDMVQNCPVFSINVQFFLQYGQNNQQINSNIKINYSNFKPPKFQT